MSSEPPYRTSATKSDVAFLTADVALALRSVVLALISIRMGRTDYLDDHIKEIEAQADELWKAYQTAIGVSSNDE